MAKKTRQELIDSGKIWQITPKVNPDHILFEGTETQCHREIKEKYRVQNRNGEVTLAKLIWEKENSVNH